MPGLYGYFSSPDRNHHLALRFGRKLRDPAPHDDRFTRPCWGAHGDTPEDRLRGRGRSALLTVSLPSGESRLRHHSLHYEALAHAAGCDPARIPGSCSGAGDTLAVFPGAAYGGSKRWNAFPEAVRMAGIRAVFYGTAREKDSLKAMARECGGEAEWGLSIPDLALRLRRSRACLGNDSGGVHLAAALGVPTVAVFCSTSPAWTAPRGPRVRVVSAGAPCSPCFRRECPRGNPVCISGILPGTVAKEVLDV